MDSLIALAGLAVTVLSAAFGAVIWFVRLEGRVNTGNELFKQFKEQYEKEYTALSTVVREGFNKIEGAVERVFEKLDGKADK